MFLLLVLFVSSFLNESAKGGSDTIAIIMLQDMGVLVKKMCLYGIRNRIAINLYYDDLTIITMATLMQDHMIVFNVIMIQDSTIIR